MALSKEYQFFHLTPVGWVDGSFEGDVLGGSYKVAVPEDRVLTIEFIDELPAPFSKPFYRVIIDWQSDNEKLITKLKAKFGDLPKSIQQFMSKS